MVVEVEDNYGALSEDETEQRGKDPNAITQEEEDEFNRELAKMMSGTGEPRKATERKPVALDFGVPLVRRQRARSYNDDDDEVEETGKVMNFTLLTKKGSKQQVRRLFCLGLELRGELMFCAGKTLTMEIPLESAIAMHTLEKRAQDKAEQQELKRRVLDYEHREEAAEKQGPPLPVSSLQPFISPTDFPTSIHSSQRLARSAWSEPSLRGASRRLSTPPSPSTPRFTTRQPSPASAAFPFPTQTAPHRRWSAAVRSSHQGRPLRTAPLAERSRSFMFLAHDRTFPFLLPIQSRASSFSCIVLVVHGVSSLLVCLCMMCL